MDLVTRPASLPPATVKSVEGEYRPGPYFLPITGGWLSADAGRYMNWWQLGFDPVGANTGAMVEACISAYAQTIAMCPGDHWREKDGGGRERVKNSALARIIKRPNSYQSISDFLLNATRSLYLDGNTYALALRNDRFEISELHLMHPRQSKAIVAETGDVFYQLAGNPIIDRRFDGQLIVPSRDVLHVRLHTPAHPLIGCSPIQAAAMDVAASGAMTAQQVQFYLNQSRPSQVLMTDEKLTPEQITMLRERWNEQSRGLAQGGTPILAWGLKPHALTVSAQDAQLVEVMKLTEQHIALVFRVPLQILGIGGTTYSTTEALMAHWLSNGLNFALNHIEEAFGQLFGLKGYPDEYLELNTSPLLRSAHKDRIAALAQGVQGGIYSPNEARLEEGLPPVEFGDEPRVQQQVVPLSAAEAIPSAPPSPGAPPAAGPEDDTPDEGANDNDRERLRRSFRASHARSLAV